MGSKARRAARGASAGQLKIHRPRFSYVLGSIEHFEGDKIAGIIVVEDDPRSSFITLGHIDEHPYMVPSSGNRGDMWRRHAVPGPWRGSAI
jgi:hypothetical protein